jgi:two-component system nitrate/nitrite response regulator NarL
MIKVIIAEDHQALIDGVVSFFEYNDEIEIICTANNGKELLKQVKKNRPDIVITDIRMPIMDGVESTIELKKKYPDLNILAFTMFDQPNAIKKMLKAGAIGYILKNSGLKIMLEAIRKVANNKEYFDPNVLINLKKEKAQKRGDKTQKRGVLSKREKEILQLIIENKTSVEISEILFIAKTTVDTHRKNMIRKLRLTSQNDLLKYAMEKKISFK